MSSSATETPIAASATTTAEIAGALAALCRAGKFEEPYATLYAPDARSVEGTGEVAAGLETILAKAAQWGEENEVTAMTVTGPFVATDQFALLFDMAIRSRKDGSEMAFREVALYTVRDGRIVEEKFLYGGE